MTFEKQKMLGIIPTSKVSLVNAVFISRKIVRTWSEIGQNSDNDLIWPFVGIESQFEGREDIESVEESLRDRFLEGFEESCENLRNFLITSQ